MLEFDKRGMWMWFTNTELCRTADYDSQKAVTAFGEYKVGAFRKLFLLSIKEESQGVPQWVEIKTRAKKVGHSENFNNEENKKTRTRTQS